VAWWLGFSRQLQSRESNLNRALDSDKQRLTSAYSPDNGIKGWVRSSDADRSDSLIPLSG
jgi:hypothetical protein